VKKINKPFSVLFSSSFFLLSFPGKSLSVWRLHLNPFLHMQVSAKETLRNLNNVNEQCKQYSDLNVYIRSITRKLDKLTRGSYNSSFNPWSLYWQL